MAHTSVVILVVFCFFYLRESSCTTLTLRNNCPSTIWPATVAGGGASQLNTGFELQPGASIVLNPPTGWQGRLWPRTLCTTDAAGKFTCAAGDCASGTVACNGAGGIPPATLVEFTLNGYQGKDFYDISLVDGFNLPVSVAPVGGSQCTTSSCPADINRICPEQLQVKDSQGTVVACKSSCRAFNTDEECCRGAFNDPNKCKPSDFARSFKNACPQAYSYAYDDATSTFTCVGSDYLITFCP